MMGASIETTLELWASSLQPTLVGPPIELDDYRRAIDELLPAVSASLAAHRDRVEEMFLKTKAERFVPVP
jgi:uncharacterized protein